MTSEKRTARRLAASDDHHLSRRHPGLGNRFAVGGEFELEMPQFSDADGLERLTHGLSGTWVVSGRAALNRILRKVQERGVRHVHLPAYLCESVLQPVKARGMEFSFYPVDEHLIAHPDP